MIFSSAFAVSRALDDGAEKFPPGNWRTVSLADHLRHAVAHAQKAYEIVTSSGERSAELRTELSHLACRSDMAYALFEETEKNS